VRKADCSELLAICAFPFITKIAQSIKTGAADFSLQGTTRVSRKKQITKQHRRRRRFDLTDTIFSKCGKIKKVKISKIQADFGCHATSLQSEMAAGSTSGAGSGSNLPIGQDPDEARKILVQGPQRYKTLFSIGRTSITIGSQDLLYYFN
jgi:hypothetical protein